MSESALIVDVTQSSFAQAVIEESHRRPVLVDFWADWCQPCQMLMPVLEKLVQEFDGGFLLAKVDTVREAELAGQFGIRSLPTLMLFHKGEPIDQIGGVQPLGVLRAMLRQVAATPIDRAREQARALSAKGDTEAAEQLLRKTLAEAPDEHGLRIDLACLRAAAGDTGEAQALYEELPANVRLEPEAKALRAQLDLLAQSHELPPRAELEQRLNRDPDDADAAYRMALHDIAGGNYPAAMEILFSLIQRGAENSEQAKKSLLEVFDLLGDEEPLVKQYRRKMFAALH